MLKSPFLKRRFLEDKFLKCPLKVNYMNSLQFKGRTLVVATMHGKEKVILPAVEARLGVRGAVAPGLNTDQFGTFTGEIPREGSPLEAARCKVLAALDATGAGLGIGSEGSFGPHPAIPFLAADAELLLFVDRESGLELVAQEISSDTNYGRQTCRTLTEVEAFAQRVLFPSHALIVHGGDIHEKNLVTKGIAHPAQLREAARAVLDQQGTVTVETDMRAFHNPSRMRVIAKATETLLHKLNSPCPVCGWPGFVPREKVPGLPCAWCGESTSLALAVVSRCDRCYYTHELHYPDGLRKSDPAYCNGCNP
jgi:hypothetical protein